MDYQTFKEKFKVTSKKIKKALNWEIDYRCPHCGHKSRDDAFNAIEITGNLSHWDCPYCRLERKGMHQEAAEASLVGPDFRELMKTFQLHFLDGYLQCLFVYQDREIYLYFEDDEMESTKPLPAFWYDLSSAATKIYTALEVYLSYQIRRELQNGGAPEDVIDLILIDKRPQVNDYLDMWKRLGIWHSLGEKINEKHLKELNKITKEFFSCQKVRNKIVHYGHIVTREEFLMIFECVGRFIAGTQQYLDN